MAYNVIKISQPVLIMKKKVTISRAPHRGSINFPTNTSVKTSTTTYSNIICSWPDIFNQKKYVLPPKNEFLRNNVSKQSIAKNVVDWNNLIKEVLIFFCEICNICIIKMGYLVSLIKPGWQIQKMIRNNWQIKLYA